MKIGATIVAIAIACGTAHADEASRRDKIVQIAEAQGLTQMFQSQLDQSVTSAADIGRSLVKKMLEEAGVTDPAAVARLEPIYRRYMERCASMFTAREFVDLWVKAYGEGLSEADLTQILAYYRSPAGRKEVASTQKAMVTFSQSMMALSRERLNASTGQLMQELKQELAR